MRAIILTAKGVPLVPEYSAFSSERTRSTLNWTIPALQANSIEDIVLVGGHEIEKLPRLQKDVRILYNAEWRTSGMLHSLFLAGNALEGPCLVSYGDVLYGKECVEKLLRQRGDADAAILIDSRWRSRFKDRSDASLRKAEKVELAGSLVKRIGCDLDPSAEAEFCGLLFLGARAAERLKTLYDKGTLLTATLARSLQLLVSEGLDILGVDVEGNWAELDSAQDVAQFIFRSKARALETLGSVVTRGKFLEQVSFRVREWRDDPKGVLSRVQKTLQAERLAVRSCSQSEDQANQTGAGRFKSILKVGRDTASLSVAIEEVIQSYEKDAPDGAGAESQVLVQPYLEEATASGVMFSCDLRSGAPYFSISYEDGSETDGVTSGRSRKPHVFSIYRRAGEIECADPIQRARLAQLVELMRELEELVGPIPLDVEFAFDRHGDLYVFQVRMLPLTEGVSSLYRIDIAEDLSASRRVLDQRKAERPWLLGNGTCLTNMTDWNPVEMIGSHPRPLASSLYEKLITHQAWRVARARIGYRDVAPEKLMYLLAGQPYIDVRCSFNSLVPSNLSDACAEKLVNAYLNKLRRQPELQDKVEFEIVLSCLVADIDARLDRIEADADLTPGEREEIKASLAGFTHSVLDGGARRIQETLGSIERLGQRRSSLKRKPGISPAETASILLDDCMELGTIPFAILARYAFIATSILKSLVSQGAMDAAQCELFFRSFSTVAGEFARDYEDYRKGRSSWSFFSQRYGHLRPGTYEITSLRYDEAPETYFSGVVDRSSEPPRDEDRGGTSRADDALDLGMFPGATLKRIEETLSAAGFRTSAEALFLFAREAIKAREYAKFEFTKNISDAFESILAVGQAMGISREDCAYLRIDEITAMGSKSWSRQEAASLTASIESRKAEYQRNKRVLLPPVILQDADFEIVESRQARPNFISHAKVEAPACLLAGGIPKEGLQGKIVLIENADPGYDWIFTHPIKGLITQYGGAASHMAIRCAEFGLPAAIGCGELLFDELASKHFILLDCDTQTVRGT